MRWLPPTGVLLLLAATAGSQITDTTTTTVVEETTTTSTTTTVTLPVPTITIPDPTTITLPLPTTTTLPPPPPTTTTLPGGCLPGTPVGCDDRNPCTLDVCDLNGACLHTPLPDTSPCDDGDACTQNDRCLAGRCAGTPISCADGIACTRDLCVLGVCIHQPSDVRCDRAECEVGTCLPGNAKADKRGCVAVPVHEGQGCTGDGFSCTDDVCTRGVCLHVPVDARCVPPDTCSSPVCAPSSPGHDAAGCVPGTPRPDNAPCAEDGDVCTLDVCRGALCSHEPETDVAACAPVQQPFRQAKGLENLAADLQADIAPADGDVSALLARLALIQDDLAAAADALAGDTGIAPTVARAAASSNITAQERARIAFTTVLRTPRQISAFLQLLTQARARAALGQPATRDLRKRGKALLRGTRHFRAALRRVAK